MATNGDLSSEEFEQFLRDKSLTMGAFCRSIGIGERTLHRWLQRNAFPRSVEILVRDEHFRLIRWSDNRAGRPITENNQTASKLATFLGSRTQVDFCKWLGITPRTLQRHIHENQLPKIIEIIISRSGPTEKENTRATQEPQ